MLWSVLGLCALTACGGSDPDRVVVQLSNGELDASAIDRVVLTIAASRSASAYAVCEPFQVWLPLTGEATDATAPEAVTLPYSLSLETGKEFDGRLYIRVEGRQGSTVRFRTERMASLRGGDVRIHVHLDPECLDRGVGPGEHCLDGLLRPAPYSDIFDEGVGVVPGAQCLDGP